MQSNDRISRRYILHVVCFILIAVSLANRPLLADEPCAAADALLQAGFVDDAKLAYVSLLKGESKPPCARQGLKKSSDALLAKKLELAKFHEATDNKKEAIAAYKEALGLAHDLDAAVKAVQGIQQSDKKVVALLSRVRMLAELGFHQEALDELKQSLTGDGIGEAYQFSIPDDLQYLSGGKITFWRELRRNLEPWVRPVLEIAGLVVLLILFVRLMGIRFSRYRQLEITDFDRGGFKEEHIGKDFASLLRSQLKHMAKGTATDNAELVEGPIQTIPIPQEVEEVVPTAPASWLSPLNWVKALPALANWLFPRRTVKLAGSLHKPAKRGIGVTIQLVEKSRILTSYTVWQKEFDGGDSPPDDDEAAILYQLAEYAAILMLFEIAERYHGGIELLGTRDWRSYAEFRAGVRAQQLGHDEAAKRLYIQALRRDPKFRGALVNLANLVRDAGDSQLALELLELAKRQAEEAKDGDKEPTLYSAMYTLALLKYELGQVAEAKAEIEDLLRKIDEMSSNVLGRLIGEVDKNLTQHLRAIKPSARAVLGGLMIELNEPEGKDIIEELAKDPNASPQLKYNLACSYSMLAAREEDTDQRDKYLDESLLHFRRSLLLKKNLAEDAADDRSLQEVRNRREDEYKAIVAKYVPTTSSGAKSEPLPT